jgi:hypothetical protein
VDLTDELLRSGPLQRPMPEILSEEYPLIAGIDEHGFYRRGTYVDSQPIYAFFHIILLLPSMYNTIGAFRPECPYRHPSTYQPLNSPCLKARKTVI